MRIAGHETMECFRCAVEIVVGRGRPIGCTCAVIVVAVRKEGTRRHMLMRLRGRSALSFQCHFRWIHQKSVGRVWLCDEVQIECMAWQQCVDSRDALIVV